MERYKHEGAFRGHIAGVSALESTENKQTLVCCESLPDCLVEVSPQFPLTLGISFLTFLFEGVHSLQQRRGKNETNKNPQMVLSIDNFHVALFKFKLGYLLP